MKNDSNLIGYRAYYRSGIIRCQTAIYATKERASRRLDAILLRYGIVKTSGSVVRIEAVRI